MQHHISNRFLSAIINEKGAELCSIKNSRGKEFIWQAHPDFWNRHAPVLFPFVGRLKEDTYLYEGQLFNCGQHGFARDCTFNMVASDIHTCTFELVSDESTYKKFPFHFSLQTIYTLKDNILFIKHIIKNKSLTLMPFSIGAHPAFICPFESEESFEDYFLEFEKPETLKSFVLNNGLIEESQFDVLANENIITLNYETFKKIDTYIFQNIKSDWVELKSSKSKWVVRVSLKGFPYLGIWTKPDAPYLCIEPWFGLADFKNHDGNIFNKKGIEVLSQNKSFECTYSITVSEL